MVHEVVRLTPNIVEVVVRAPIAARAFQPGQFYRLQNYETLAPRTERHRARHGRPRAHRRVGRSRERPALHHRSRNGRIVRSLRSAEARRAGDPDGSHRHAQRNAVEGNGAAGRRRTRQRRAVLHRPEAARKKVRASSTSPATRRSSTATKWKRSKRPPTSWSGCCDEAPGFTAGRVQDSAFVGNIVEAMVAYGRGELGENDHSAALGGSPDRDRLGRHDAGRSAGPPHRARSRI